LVIGCSGSEDSKSRLVTLLTDAPGEFQKVPLTVSGLLARYVGSKVADPGQYRRAAEGGDAAGTPVQAAEEGQGKWLNLMTREQQQDLLQLRDGKTVGLSDADAPAGFYNQIRLRLKSCQVVIDGQTHEVAVPEGGIELQYNFELKAGEGQELVLDLDAAQAIQKNAAGNYELKPVLSVKQFRQATRTRECAGEGECRAEQAEECGDAACQQRGPVAECDGVCQGPQLPAGQRATAPGSRSDAGTQQGGSDAGAQQGGSDAGTQQGGSDVGAPQGGSDAGVPQGDAHQGAKADAGP
jgi:hypothetical protein